MSSLEKLYQSPLGTAGEFAVVVSGAVGAARPKLTHAPHNLTLMQVYAGRPVYAKCTAEAGCLTIEATDQSTDGTRVYFLPWSIGSIYRIRPKVEDTVELNGNLFFTPNLDGCMVTVEGTPQNPTIYHANSKNPALNFFEKELLKEVKGTENEGKVENMIKIGKMKADQFAFSKIPTQEADDARVRPSA